MVNTIKAIKEESDQLLEDSRFQVAYSWRNTQLGGWRRSVPNMPLFM